MNNIVHMNMGTFLSLPSPMRMNNFLSIGRLSKAERNRRNALAMRANRARQASRQTRRAATPQTRVTTQARRTIPTGIVGNATRRAVNVSGSRLPTSRPPTHTKRRH